MATAGCLCSIQMQIVYGIWYVIYVSTLSTLNWQCQTECGNYAFSSNIIMDTQNEIIKMALKLNARTF